MRATTNNTKISYHRKIRINIHIAEIKSKVILIFMRKTYLYLRIAYPTLPSKLTANNFWASTANSIGN